MPARYITPASYEAATLATNCDAATRRKGCRGYTYPDNILHFCRRLMVPTVYTSYLPISYLGTAAVACLYQVSRHMTGVRRRQLFRPPTDELPDPPSKTSKIGGSPSEADTKTSKLRTMYHTRSAPFGARHSESH